MKLCITCSPGGHLTEMLELEEAFTGHQVFGITYDTERTRSLMDYYLIDNFASQPLKSPIAIATMLRVLIREKPDVILSTGAEIAIPAFIIAKLIGARTIYIESCARVTSSSATGRLLYPISDFFFVQWKETLRAYGKKARYKGGLL